MWNARASVTGGELLEHVPNDWGPILDSIGSADLPYLCVNAEAWKAGRSHFDVNIEGAPYRRIRTSPYCIRCLEKPGHHFDELSEADQCGVQELLAAQGCWLPLWRVEGLHSGMDPDGKAPFAGDDSPKASDSMTGLSAREAETLHWLPVAVPKRTD